MDPKNPNNNNDEKGFTVDHEDQFTREMPSITKLLNRKKLGLSTPPKAAPAPAAAPSSPASPAAKAPVKPAAPSNPMLAGGGIPVVNSDGTPAGVIRPSAAPPAPPLPSEGIAISVVAPDAAFERTSRVQSPRGAASPQPPAPGSSIPAGLKVQPSRRTRAAAPELARLEPGTMRLSQDPLSKSLVTMIDKGAAGCLYLSLLTPPGAAFPQFLAKSAYGAPTRLALWRGWRWDTSLTQQVWAQVAKNGAFEIPPTDQKLGPVFRAALGAEKDEWILIVRAGAAASMCGVIFFTSKASLAANYSGIRQLLTSVRAESELKLAA